MKSSKIDDLYGSVFVKKNEDKTCIIETPDIWDSFDFEDEQVCKVVEEPIVDRAALPTVHSVLKGDTGLQGEQGIEGNQGIVGEQGDQGLSSYEIWLSEGNTGTEDDFLITLRYSDEGLKIEHVEYEGFVGQTDFDFDYTEDMSIEVYYNGYLLSETDWTTNVDGIVLNQPVTSTGDVIFIRAFNVFPILDAVTEDEFNNRLSDDIGTVSDFESSLL